MESYITSILLSREVRLRLIKGTFHTKSFSEALGSHFFPTAAHLIMKAEGKSHGVAMNESSGFFVGDTAWLGKMTNAEAASCLSHGGKGRCAAGTFNPHLNLI